MATVSIKARLPSDPDPVHSPPDAVEPYPPNQLFFLRTQRHAAAVSDLLATDYVSASDISSLSRWVRLEALGLVANERVDNIRVWYENSGDVPEELTALEGLESEILTNCSVVPETDTISPLRYYGSRNYGDATYTSNLRVLPILRPVSANVGIDGSLLGQITRTSQPAEMIENGGASDWIYLQITKTQALRDFSSSEIARHVFGKSIFFEWDEYLVE